MMAAVPESAMWSRIPIVVILGATGTGKSKLGIEIAKRFNGEIISADSMQVYRGLDIVTNKVTSAERTQVEHHMIDVLDPPQRFTVLDFRNIALPRIQEVHARGKLPILVGGTNYYVESILWNVLVDDVTANQGSLAWDRDPQTSPKTSSNKKIKLDVCASNSNLDQNILSLDLSKSNIDHSKSYLDPIQSSLDSSDPNLDPLKSCLDHSKSNLKQIKADFISKANLDLSNSSLGPFNCSSDSKSSKMLKIDQNKTGQSGANDDKTTASGSTDDVSCLSEDTMIESGSNNDKNGSSDDKIIENSSNYDKKDSHEVKRSKNVSNLDEKSDCWENLSNTELHTRLTEVDPQTANSLHPNNRRKIIRALQVWYNEGRTLSQVLAEQRALNGGSNLGGPLRFPCSTILWIQCDQSTLDSRLDSRVDTMMSQGLVQELTDFHHTYNMQRLAENLGADYSQGIFQSIGFKEFHAYLVLPREEKETERGEKLLLEGIAALKLVTRRYARKQLRWINNRVLRQGREAPQVYGLDGSDISQWDELVLTPATTAVAALLSNTTPDLTPIVKTSQQRDTCREFCQVCQRLFVDLDQWRGHLASKRHKRQLVKRDRSIVQQ